MPKTKGGMVLNNMAAMTLHMWPLSSKMKTPWVPTDMVGNHLDIMKMNQWWRLERRRQPACWTKQESAVSRVLPMIQWKGRHESPAPELVIKYGKREKSCLVDGEMSSAHANATGTSWGMEISEGSQHHPIWPWPCWTRHGWERKDSWWMELSEGGQQRPIFFWPIEGTIRETEMIPGGWNSHKDVITSSMILVQLKS